MVKKFLDGLAFGAGFGISIVAIWVFASWVGSQLVSPPVISDTASPSAELRDQDGGTAVEDSPFAIAERTSSLSPEERIAEANEIALVKYEESDDGLMRSIISEILKKDPDTELGLDVGEEFFRMSFYPEPNERRADAEILFLADPSGKSWSSMPIYGTRIPGLGNMPLDLFREKIEEVAP